MKPSNVRPRFSKSRLVLALLLASMAFNFVTPAGALAQSSGECRSLSHEELMKAVPYNPVGSVLQLSQRFIPPRVRLDSNHPMGDSDFAGHGPLISAKVRLYYAYDGIAADVWMRAIEVDKDNRPKKDYTAVEGSGRKVFFRSPRGWYINAVETYWGTYPTMSRLPKAIDPSPGHAGGDWQMLNRRDPNGHKPELISQPDFLLGGITVIGDTDGPEAGSKTGIEIGLPVPLRLELCRGDAPKR